MSSEDLFSLAGRVAVVTGASRGIGEAIARAYAEAGATVVLSSRKQEGLDRVAAAIERAGGRALPVAAHAGRPDEVEALFERAATELGGVDVLVNNAATNPHFGPLLEASESQWQKTLEVNLLGYVYAIRAAVPRFVARGGGKVVNVASIAARHPLPGLGVYSVTKAAVVALTRALALELADRDVQVNALAPGVIETRFSEALWKDPERSDRNLAAIPAGRFGTPRDLLGLALYLAAPASDFTTGAVFTVDGGQTVG